MPTRLLLLETGVPIHYLEASRRKSHVSFKRECVSSPRNQQSYSARYRKLSYLGYGSSGSIQVHNGTCLWCKSVLWHSPVHVIVGIHQPRSYHWWINVIVARALSHQSESRWAVSELGPWHWTPTISCLNSIGWQICTKTLIFKFQVSVIHPYFLLSTEVLITWSHILQCVSIPR